MAAKSIESRHGRLRIYEHDIVKAGAWVAATYPPSARILMERYSYLPPGSFDDVVQIRSIDSAAIKRFHPDVLILNSKQSRRYSWKQPGTSFAQRKLVRGKNDGAGKYLTFHATKLFAPDSEWKIVYEKFHAVVLERKE